MIWNTRPFDSVRQALSDAGSNDGAESVRLDPGRLSRTGVPELILAGSKTSAEVHRSLVRLATAIGRATATRCRDDQLIELPGTFADGAFTVEVHNEARAITVSVPEHERRYTGGRVAVITAGSSDIPVALEAALIAREMGCEVFEVRDVGVAGLHRLVRPLEQLAESQVDVIVVAAGMDGALPSVVAGLVPVPVIGLPTSVGYGHGGSGEGALTTMLQSCAPGLVVVNIDNRVGAGAAAAKIANLAASERR